MGTRLRHRRVTLKEKIELSKNKTLKWLRNELKNRKKEVIKCQK